MKKHQSIIDIGKNDINKEKMKGNTKYIQRIWLNDINSPQTGNIVAYDGDLEFNDGLHHSTFLSISDCHSTIRLHKSEYDTEEEFIKKMKKLREVIDNFIEHLESEYIKWKE